MSTGILVSSAPAWGCTCRADCESQLSVAQSFLDGCGTNQACIDDMTPRVAGVAAELAACPPATNTSTTTTEDNIKTETRTDSTPTNTVIYTGPDPKSPAGTSTANSVELMKQNAFLDTIAGLEKSGSSVISSEEGQSALGSDAASAPSVSFAKAYELCQQVKKSGSIGANSQPDCATADAAFLNNGPAQNIAATFEKDSGMNAKEALALFNQIAKEKSQTSGSRYDQALRPAKEIAAKIPNEDFREKVLKNLNEVPEGTKKKIEAELNGKMSGENGSAPNAAALAAASDLKPGPPIGSFPGSSGLGASSAAQNIGAEGGLSKFGGKKQIEIEKMQKKELEELEKMLAGPADKTPPSAGSSQEEGPKDSRTIFERVSSQYRKKLKFFQFNKLLIREKPKP